MTDYLSQLNEQQREAVEFLDAPQLVIAGAGSGKTRVITYKIVHLLAKGYKPWRIMAITFTNKAANEMKERVTELMGAEMTRRLWMGTFHSIFLRILRQHTDRFGYIPGFTIYDTSDSKNLVKAIIKDMNLDDKVYKASTVLNTISMAKNALISPDAYASNRDLMDIDRRSKKPLLYAIYAAYQKRCVLSNAMDFDDILYYTYLLLRDNEEIRNHYREYFQYVLVDEYQDTNYAQHVIVKYLTEGQNNLMVVGDDAQSIYSFRGANIDNILRLGNSYPNLKTFKLERNYRSTKNIIEAANSLISKNVQQIKKHIFTDNEIGNTVEVIQCYSDIEEGYLAAGKIVSCKMQNHDNFSDYAILYRTNAQSRVLEESLRKRNIPYKLYGALSFYQRKEVKDALAYFRLAVNPYDDESLHRIINYPARGIGDTTQNKIMHAAFERNVSMWQIISDENIADLKMNSGTRKKIDEFRSMLLGFIEKVQQGSDVYEVAADIIKTTGLMSAFLSDNTPETISKRENLNELLSSVKDFVDRKLEEGDDTHIGMIDYLSEVSLATDTDNDSENLGDAVTMMTVHAAKGLEYNNVLIVGVEEELFPAMLSMSSPSGLEEERRLMYVAITRAKKNCFIFYSKTRYRNGMSVICRPSRFIGEIDARFMKYPGQRTSQNQQSYNDPLQRYREEKSMMLENRRNIPRHIKPQPLQATRETETEFGLHTISEMKVGKKIEHSRFGVGIIVDLQTVEENDRIVVQFENNETKTLMLKFARFKLIR